ncbi:helix-turn-helix domain-containing protein, partial [Klebsiella pneumoniae]|uniref:helix-turn-helix domain-containing protein n=2 Tax=Pseudomonadota TaxID=1224 RepID=UPI003D0868F9
MSNIVRSQDGRGDVLAHVASNLRRLRRAAGLSQTALATTSGISRRMITNLEGGDTNISLSSLDRLAEALG